MDKNTIIGFVLIAAVLFGYSWFTKPTPEQLQELQRRNDSIAQVEQKKLEEIQQSQMVCRFDYHRSKRGFSSSSTNERSVRNLFGLYDRRK